MMHKKVYLSLVIIGFALLVHTAAEAQTSTFNSVRLAIKAGDAESLIRFFDSTVELKTDSEEGAYSKNQAQFVLKKFFNKYRAVSFSYNHEGSSPGGSKYVIGTYTCESSSFRVFLKSKSVNGVFVIDQLEFTKEK